MSDAPPGDKPPARAGAGPLPVPGRAAASGSGSGKGLGAGQDDTEDYATAVADLAEVDDVAGAVVRRRLAPLLLLEVSAALALAMVLVALLLRPAAAPPAPAAQAPEAPPPLAPGTPAGSPAAPTTDAGAQTAELDLSPDEMEHEAAIDSTGGVAGSDGLQAGAPVAEAAARLVPDSVSRPTMSAGEPPPERPRHPDHGRDQSDQPSITSDARVARHTRPLASAAALGEEDLRVTLRPHIPEMTDCAESYHGAVTLHFTVVRGGQVSAVTASGADLPPRVADCLGNLLEGVRFTGYAGPEVRAGYFVVF